MKENNMPSAQRKTGIYVPLDENGDYLFTLVPPEQTYAFLNNLEDLTAEEVGMIVDLNIKNAQERVEKLEGKRPKPTPYLNEYRASKAEWEAEKRQAQADLDYWNQVKAIGTRYGAHRGRKNPVVKQEKEKVSFEAKAMGLLAFLLVLFIALAFSLLLNQKSAERSQKGDKDSKVSDPMEDVVGYDTVDSVAVDSVAEDYEYMDYPQSYAGSGPVERVLNIDPDSYRESSTASGSRSTSRPRAGARPTEKYYEETYMFNGDVPYASYFGEGQYDANSLSELKIINKSSTDAVVLLYASTDDVLRNVFVSKGATYTMKKIPGYSCIVKVMYGNSWNAQKDNGDSFPKGGFMKDVSFSKTLWKDAFSFLAEQTSDGVSFPSYSITLHKVVNGNLGSEATSKADFFE